MAGDRGTQFDLFGGAESEVAAVAAEINGVPVSGTLPDSAPVVEKAAADMPAVLVAGSDTRVIQDAGEELLYNRRNRVRTAKSWDDVAHLNDALKVKEVVKGNIWPKPDYQKLIDDGVQPIAAHIVKQVYDSIAAKPSVGGRIISDAELQLYIVALNRVEAGLMQWVRDPAALKQWAVSNSRIAGAMMGRQISLSDLANEPRTLLDSVYPGGSKLFPGELIICGGNKLREALVPGYDVATRAIKAIKNGWPEKREAWEIQGFKVVERADVEVQPYLRNSPGHSIYYLGVNGKNAGSFKSDAEAQAAAAAIKPFVLFGKRGFVDSYDSEDEAVEGAKDLTRRDKGQVVGEKGVRVEAVEREGVCRRMEGEDISSERLMTEFGLKGVNFGNWMKTPAARAEAQLHLNHAFDSLYDLADILGVPPKAMSLNGMLGLAIGAQGSGGAFAAHFVAGLNEINLTRTMGAGSLGHEWAHAMDHYFAVQAGLATSSEPFLTEHALLPATRRESQKVEGNYSTVEISRFGALRHEIVSAFGTIVDAMNKRLEPESESLMRQEAEIFKAKGSLTYWLKNTRYDFKGQEDAFDLLSARIEAGDAGDGMIALSKTAYIAPVLVEVRDLYKAGHGCVYSIEKLKNLQAWINTVKHREAKMVGDGDHVPQQVSSQYAKDAFDLDQAKGGKPYWSTTLEKFARAFDSFISDELVGRQAKNGYLSHTGLVGATVPNGAERIAVNAAFRGLVGAINVRETERGAALFSAGAGTALQTMPIAAIHDEINRLRGQWKSMPKVTVVQAVKDLPFEAPDNADGAYCDRRVYVIAENVVDLKQLQKVMAHECVMHHSLDEMLGNYGFSKLHVGIQKLKADGDPIVGALAANILSRYGVLPPEIETKEIVARAGEQCLDATGNVQVSYGFMKSVFAGVAGWLRDHGIAVPFSNTELQGIMHSAGEWVRRAPEGVDKGQGPAPSADRLDGVARDQISQDDCPAVKIVDVGEFVGKVIEISGGVATQKTGRGGEMVKHLLSKLSAPVEIGRVADIRYRDGVGVVGCASIGTER